MYLCASKNVAKERRYCNMVTEKKSCWHARIFRKADGCLPCTKGRIYGAEIVR
jgi:hypothetical protein